MTVAVDGEERQLPASRKTRALLAYLALARGSVSRSSLCELLWDGPRDPRAELRWSLSRLRPVVDTHDCVRLAPGREAVELDLGDVLVDAREIARAAEGGLETVSAARQRELLALFRGELLDDLESDVSPLFDAWLTAERRRLRGCRLALLEQLARGAGKDAERHLEQWLALAPLDLKAHAAALARFASGGQIREGEEHLRSAVRLLECEGLDAESLRDHWRKVRRVVRRGPVSIAGTVPARRASIAVLPFAGRAQRDGGGVLGEAFARDVITRLAKLRSMFVIAAGTVLALRERDLGPEEIGRLLNVDYVASGSLQRSGQRITIAVDLVETRSARIVWTETFERRIADTLRVLDETGDRIVAELAGQIELSERNRALLKPPSSLDAWDSHHRGLWHAYRFNHGDNRRARRLFAAAIRLDATFSRAYAGLSFTHFQAAFQGWGERRAELARASHTAERALLADDRDPAAHWAMGRALWLNDDQRRSIAELEQAVQLSPNYALGHYMLGFVHAQSGDPHAAIAAADLSRNLSPFDPLLFGMLGARALALLRLERYAEAADYALKAAARPNAHAHIVAIAALTLALAGSVEDGRRQAAAIRRRSPRYSVGEFLATFRFDRSTERQFRAGARLLGMS